MPGGKSAATTSTNTAPIAEAPVMSTGDTAYTSHVLTAVALRAST
jgi:hypothetical protein